MVLDRKPAAVFGISGPIGVGKSTLVDGAVSPPYKWMFLELLKAYPRIPPVVEKYQERFDPDLLELQRKCPPEYVVAFQSDMLVHSVTLEGLIAEKGGMAFLDRTIYEHRHVFAEVQQQRGTLEGEAFNAYDHLFQVFRRKVPPPLAYIYMKASLESQRERIRKRGRPQEAWLLGDDPYLQQLNDAYDRFFGEIVEQPVITVDANDIVTAEPTKRKRSKSPSRDYREEDMIDHAFFQRVFPQIIREIRDRKILDRLVIP